MKRFFKYTILTLGVLLAGRAIWDWSLDSAFGPEYEAVKRFKIGSREVVASLQNGGATTDYATSFHILLPGSNPSTFNRVLVIPNHPDELEMSLKENTIFIEAPRKEQTQFGYEAKFFRDRFQSSVF